MTQQEILEYNKRCAEFLKIITNDGFWVEFDKLMPNEITMSYSKRHHIEHLLFHSDWNWIMEVIETIEKLKYGVEVVGNYCHIIGAGIYSSQKDKKEAVIKSINEFLILYNENRT